MLPPPAFLTTEARLAPKGAAIDNAFHHTRCCCAFSSFQIFCVECVGAKPAARLEVLLCAVRILQTHLGSALRSAVAISISWPRGNHCTPRLHIWMGVSTFAGLRPLLAYPPYFSRPSPSDPFSLARPCASDTALDQTCYDGGWDWSRRNTESYDPRAGANQRF